MRAFQLVAPRQTELREVDVPEPGPAEVLLKVAAAGVCHSDLHLVHAPALPYTLPMTLGHEVAGRVAATGSDVEGWEEGQAALVYLCWGCGRCRNCIGGAENYCLAHPKNSVPGAGLGRQGGMSDYIVVPSRHVLPLGDLDPVAAAPLADAALTPYHAIAEARALLLPGATVVVIGVGGLGNLAVQVLVATTPARVIAVDTDESRLRMAQERGASDILLAGSTTAEDVIRMTEGLGAELVLDLVGSEETLHTAADCVATGGRISILGLAAGRLPVLAGPPPFAMPWGVSVARPYAGSRRELLEVLSLARSGDLEVPVEAHPLTQAREVLDRLSVGKVRGRAVLVP